MVSQFERLQMKMTQQKELIEQMKKENESTKVHTLATMCVNNSLLG